MFYGRIERVTMNIYPESLKKCPVIPTMLEHSDVTSPSSSAPRLDFASFAVLTYVLDRPFSWSAVGTEPSSLFIWGADPTI